LTDIMPLLNDSKKLTEEQREEAFAALEAHPGVITAAAIVDAGEIDRINILQATLKAMAQAVESLPTPADAALVDGNRLPPALPVQHAAAIVKGDAKSAAIAAASIVAKVTRDRIMAAAHARFPQYGFIQHKGYPTAAHVAAIAAHGPCELHRLTFAPLKGRY
jgi:ribonuclease HII